jgi:hypothetical protein
MSTDHDRLRLYEHARDSWGDDPARTLMDLLPPDPQELATKADLLATRSELRGEMAELRTELRGEMAELRVELRGEMAELRVDLTKQMAEQTRTLVFAMLTMVLTVLTLSLGAVALG